jgi:hypothetical protein
LVNEIAVPFLLVTASTIELQDLPAATNRLVNDLSIILNEDLPAVVRLRAYPKTPAAE